MDTKEEVRAHIERGKYFQLPMVFVWFGRWAFIHSDQFGTWLKFSPSGVFDVVGLGIMLYCMIRIYFQRAKPPKLITSDLFALTRHPMYHGMFISDLSCFFNADLTNPLFWVSWLLFVSLLLGAGWYQEKETLARWGDEAREYYARTPRFIFGWLRR